MRLGNWVQRPIPYHQLGEVIQNEDQVCILHEGKRYFHYPFQLRPILITPELLELICGNSIDQDVFILNLKGHSFVLQPIEGNKLQIWQTKPFLSTQLEQVKYLHQLQNFISDIADISLPITLEMLEQATSETAKLHIA